MNRIDLTHSLEIKQPHFQKDVIIPQIYDLKNIRIIQQHGYKNSPINKVATLKKQKIQNVIKSIVYKNPTQHHPNKPLYKSLTLNVKPKSLNKQPSYRKNIQSAEKQHLFMEIDQQIGQMISLADQNFVPFAQRVKSALKKAKHNGQDQQQSKRHEDAQYFMNVLCKGANKRINPETIKPVSGLLEQIQQMQKKSKTKSIKTRAKSATLTRSKTSMQRSSQLYRSKVHDRSSSNLKQKNGLEDQLNKSKQIIKTINDCLQEESKINKSSKQKMHDMKNSWSNQGSIQQTFIRSSSMIINPSTLDILKQKRLKIQALSRIDNQYIRQ